MCTLLVNEGVLPFFFPQGRASSICCRSRTIRRYAPRPFFVPRGFSSRPTLLFPSIPPFRVLCGLLRWDDREQLRGFLSSVFLPFQLATPIFSGPFPRFLFWVLGGCGPQFVFFFLPWFSLQPDSAAYRRFSEAFSHFLTQKPGGSTPHFTGGF